MSPPLHTSDLRVFQLHSCWMADAESWTTPTQRSCCGLFPVWSLLLSGVTNGNAKIRTGVFKCKEVGRIMTFLFSCLAIHREAFLFLCHSGWHIINSCLICCLRALLPMQEALNPYTAVRDKTPVGPLPPHFNNKTEESSTQQRVSGFLFHSTGCYSVHKCHLTRSRRTSRIKASHQASDLQTSIKGRMRMVSVLQREKSSSQDLWSTSAPLWPWSAPAFIAPSTPLVLPPFSPSQHKKKPWWPLCPPLSLARSLPTSRMLSLPESIKTPPPPIVVNRWRNEKWRCGPNFVCLLVYIISFICFDKITSEQTYIDPTTSE